MNGARAPALPYASAAMLALFFWLMCGDLGLAIRDRAGLSSGLELLRRHGVSDTVTSLLLSTVPATLSMLLAPLVGYHSDHHRSRYGRRRPFLAMAATVATGAMLGLALSPALGGWTDGWLGSASPGLSACSLLWFALFWTVFECAGIAAAALFAGLVNDTMPRPVLGRFYGGLRVLNLSVGIAFNAWVFALLDHYLYEILLGIGVLFGFPLLLMCWKVAEAPSFDAPARTRRSLLVPREHVLACFRQRRFWWICGAFMAAGVTFSPFNTFYQYHAQSIGIDKATLGRLTAYGYTVSMVSAFGIGYLVDRIGAVRMAALIMAGYALTAWTGFVLIDAASFPLFYLAHVVMSGAYFTAAASMPMALMPKAQFVQYNSTKDLMVASAGIVVSALQGVVLDASGHAYRLTVLSGGVFSMLSVLCLSQLLWNVNKCNDTGQL